MARGALPFEYGRAVDCPTAKNFHQVFRVDQKQENGLYALHYSVCSPDMIYDPCDIVPVDFVESLSSAALRDEEGMKIADRQYGLFMQNLRKGLPKTNGYTLGQRRASVTFDILFDDSFEMRGFDIRATEAEMSEIMTTQQARDRVAREPQDMELKLWHDFVHHTMQTQFGEGHDVDKISFEMVTTVTSDLIKLKTYEMALENGIDCVCRYSPFEKPLAVDQSAIPRKKSLKASYYQYGSILGDERGEPRRINNLENKSVVTATASRQAVDVYNIVVLKEFLKNGGANPFEVGTSYAIAHYCDERNAIRRERHLCFN